jgi:hypothetical protein
MRTTFNEGAMMMLTFQVTPGELNWLSETTGRCENDEIAPFDGATAYREYCSNQSCEIT